MLDAESDDQSYAETLKSLMAECGAMLEGHFLLSSGLHSDRYVQCALLLAEPRRAAETGRALSLLQAQPPDLVVSPALGGMIIGHETARALGVRAYFSERDDGMLRLRRGFRIVPGEKVVVVEDVITTGRSTREVVDLVKAEGGRVIAALSIILRSLVPPDLGAPTRSLAHVPLDAFPPGECPGCRAGLPLVKPGSRTTTSDDQKGKTS